MDPLPTGTVTFLFTDIQGSTTLWEHQPAAAHAALMRHDALVEEVVVCYGGTLVRPRGEGDSRFAVFTRATDAVAAAAALLQALYAEPWPTSTPLSVRVALHTGEADVRAGDYYGQAVNRCARLRAVAHGGQALLSQATFDLVRDAVIQGVLPGVSLRDLGEHRLKDLIRPEHIHQLVVTGVPDAFPPLLSLDAHRHNLPVQRSPLLGREREVGEVTMLLLRPEVGLVTLTGPGGTGKTRLALQVAAELLGSFADGVWFVDLAPLSDPDLVLPTIAQTLGVKEAGGEPLRTTVTSYLRDKQLVLLLDNFEQVVAAAPVVADLLKAAPRLTVLVTSREVLHLSGEHDYPVPPLRVPDLQRVPTLEQLTQYAAVQLFIHRAKAVKPDFQVTNANAPAVAEICVRLDGLPLAIELAAARVKLFSPEALLQRLINRLKTLTGGGRDLAARQQTLRNTIEWSYHLLTPGERVLFRRLAVFVGGRSLDAIEAICNGAGDLPLETVDGLQSLLDKSLVRQDGMTGDESRVVLLETIHEYAWECLIASGEEVRLRQQHATYFLQLAERAEPALVGPGQAAWCERLDRDHGNLRAALEWALRAQPDQATALAGALWRFWELRGYVREGRAWLEAAQRTGRGTPAARYKVCTGAGTMAWRQRDTEHAIAFHTEALELGQQCGDAGMMAFALNNLAVQALQQGDHAGAAHLFQESLAISRASGNTGVTAIVLLNLGFQANEQGDYERAASWLEESVTFWREVGNNLGTARALINLADTRHFQGADRQAQALLEESLQVAHDLKDTNIAAVAIDGIAFIAAAHGQAKQAVRLFGATTTVFDALGVALPRGEIVRRDACLATLRGTLGEVLFTAAWAQGAAMSFEQVIEDVLAMDRVAAQGNAPAPGTAHLA